MKENIQKICYFLHITDGSGQLDLTDLSFMLIMAKLAISPNLDWASVCTLIPVLVKQMHDNHLDSKKPGNS